MVWMSRELGVPTRRGVLGLLIAGVHAVLIALFARATLLPPPAVEPPTLSISITQPEIPQHSAAPLPSPHLSTVETTAVVPDVNIQLPMAPAAITLIDSAPMPAPMPSAAPAAGPGPVEISNVDYLRQPQPRYPAQSRQAHEEGLVVVRVLIDAQGRAQQVTVVHSSGHPRLDAAACEAVMHAIFKPHLAGGVPQEALATVPVEFSLHRV
jgi:protein TonB